MDNILEAPGWAWSCMYAQNRFNIWRREFKNKLKIMSNLLTNIILLTGLSWYDDCRIFDKISHSFLNSLSLSLFWASWSLHLLFYCFLHLRCTVNTWQLGSSDNSTTSLSILSFKMKFWCTNISLIWYFKVVT